MLERAGATGALDGVRGRHGEREWLTTHSSEGAPGASVARDQQGGFGRAPGARRIRKGRRVRGLHASRITCTKRHAASHWRFQSEFCSPYEAHEKGGIEGEAGYFRRNHWMPIPQARDLPELNAQLLAACHADERRQIAGRNESPDHFFGIGYSFRFDGLFGGSVGSSP
jgi:hypothetical protein